MDLALCLYLPMTQLKVSLLFQSTRRVPAIGSSSTLDFSSGCYVPKAIGDLYPLGCR